MKKQTYKVVFYNLDTNTFNEHLIYAVNKEEAQEWADMTCTEEQDIESVELYNA